MNTINLTFKYLLLAIPFSLVKLYFEKYVFSDWEFLKFLAMIVTIDTFLGVWVNFRSHTLSSSGFAKFLTKVITYSAFLILTHILVHFKVSGKQIAALQWVDSLFYSAIIVREAISIIENIGAINPTILPTWILKRLKKFDESGNPTDLTNNQ